MNSKTGIFLYADTPKELVDVLNEIRFTKIEPERRKYLLDELEKFGQDLERKGHIQKRARRDVPAGNFTVYASVPQEAADALNKYEYPDASPITRAMLKTKALDYLKQRGIPLRSA